MHVSSPVTITALVALIAVLWGVIALRLKQSPLIGYIVAGIVLGPSGIGLVKSEETVTLLAEFGTLTLLFVVGMQLDLERFVSTWKTVVVTVLAQIGGSVGFLLLLHHYLGWSIGLAVLLGFVVSMSSTAVVVKMLEASGELSTRAGKLSVGILIAQDIAVVPLMLILGALAQQGQGFSLLDIGRIAFSILFLAGLIGFLIKRKPYLPFAGVISDSEELVPLGALAYCMGGAALSGLLNLSPSYGAFLAGLVIGNSRYSKPMLRGIQPVESILLMVFFLSTGLMLDPKFIWHNAGIVALLLFAVVVFKTLLNVGVIRLLSGSWSVAILSGVALAQIGEFSFLLSQAGVSYNIISFDDSRIVVTVTVFSLVLSPLAMILARRLVSRLEAGPITWRAFREIWHIHPSEIYRSLKRSAALLVSGWNSHAGRRAKGPKQKPADSDHKEDTHA